MPIHAGGYDAKLAQMRRFSKFSDGHDPVFDYILVILQSVKYLGVHFF